MVRWKRKLRKRVTKVRQRVLVWVCDCAAHRHLKPRISLSAKIKKVNEKKWVKSRKDKSKHLYTFLADKNTHEFRKKKKKIIDNIDKSNSNHEKIERMNESYGAFDRLCADGLHLLQQRARHLFELEHILHQNILTRKAKGNEIMDARTHAHTSHKCTYTCANGSAMDSSMTHARTQTHKLTQAYLGTCDIRVKQSLTLIKPLALGVALLRII